jgi:NAD(P)-dependent dehydrogenase (short-subunit alcohol dehydrogenase family)
MNRYGTCGEIASAVVYLLSEEARYVTGAAACGIAVVAIAG